MSWYQKKHDAVTMLAVAIVLTCATIATAFNGLAILLAFIPLAIPAMLGLVIAWFLWAWTLIERGYLPSLTPRQAIVLVSVLVPPLIAILIAFSQQTAFDAAKVIFSIVLFVVFTAAFFLPSRQRKR